VDALTEPSKHAAIEFPAYGSGGDTVGARRLRRAFRLLVAACLLLAAMLWFSEYYLRYDDAERLYIAAVTQYPESGRVLLRSAVKIDGERRKSPTPKYMAALAEQEDEDQVLPAYEKAYKLDPNNSQLAIRYGVQLFIGGQFKEARERFREAGAQPPRNALPGYLEAAALQWSTPGPSDLAESLALVARTNSRGDSVTFPRPSWPASVLPQDGEWYARLRRAMVDACCSPLYRYADLVFARAREDMAKGETQYWDSWLMTVQDMARRVMASPDLGSVQAIAGAQIQLEALELRIRLQETAGGAPEAGLVEQTVKLRSALERIADFERSRDGRIERDRQSYVFPLRLASFSTVGLCAFYAFVYAVCKLLGVGRRSWTIPHPLGIRLFLAAGSLFFFAMLCVLSFFTRDGGLNGVTQMSATLVWLGALLAFVLVGAIYPSSRLPRPSIAVRATPTMADPRECLRQARKARRVAGIALIRRYCGILTGGYLCALALWVVAFRVVVSLYPWQIKLLTTGLSAQEANVVREVLALFS